MLSLLPYFGCGRAPDDGVCQDISLLRGFFLYSGAQPERLVSFVLVLADALFGIYIYRAGLISYFPCDS